MRWGCSWRGSFAITSTAWCLAAAAAGDSFTGRVLDADTGTPIGNALVEVGNGTQPTHAARTDIDGYYTIRDVQSATDYTIMASAVGYASSYDTMMSPGTVNLSLAAPIDGFLVDTTYRGMVHYVPNSGWCARSDGTVAVGPFTDVDAQSTEIAALLASIGVGTNAPRTPQEKWDKCRGLWLWCQTHTLYSPGDPTYQDAMTFMMASGWPSIQRIAETFDVYGFLPWGTCMSRAQLFTTLLYRTGIDRDELGLCETVWRFRYSQHMYTGVWICERWIYLDPTYNHLAIPAFDAFTSLPVAGAAADYCHPVDFSIIPGSSLAAVPALTARGANDAAIFITAPPEGTWTTDAAITIHGVVSAAATEVVINGNSVPVTGGLFTANVPLNCGANTITALVNVGGDDFSDTIHAGRWCRGDLDLDGDVDLADFALFSAHLAGPDHDPGGDPLIAAAADRDDDGDVDLADFARFQPEVAP
jgi:hypothetical protein